MNIEQFREFCLSLPHVTEKMPFLDMKHKYSSHILCFYIADKWFCFVNIEEFDRCCLKLDIDMAAQLREEYDGIRPAWHMNKKYWNDVYFHADVPDRLIFTLVRQSYDIVFSSLPTKTRNKLNSNSPIP